MPKGHAEEESLESGRLVGARLIISTFCLLSFAGGEKKREERVCQGGDSTLLPELNSYRAAGSTSWAHCDSAFELFCNFLKAAPPPPYRAADILRPRMQIPVAVKQWCPARLAFRFFSESLAMFY